MSSATFYKYSVIAILFSIILTPSIFIPGFIGIRLEELCVAIFAFAVLFTHKENGWIIRIPLRVILLLFFWPIILISTFVGILHSLPTALADLSKIVWLIKAVIIYLIFYNFVTADTQERNSRIDFILRYFVKFSVISAVICIQQFFDVFSINSLYVPIVAPTQFVPLMPGYPSPRSVGMVGNPNVQGLVLSLALVVFMYISLKSKKKVSIFTLSILFVALLMTLSRGALVAFMAGAVLLFVSYKKGIRFLITRMIFGVSVLMLLYFAYDMMLENQAIFDAMLFRFQLLEHATEDESFTMRFDTWAFNLELFKIDPIFGVGLLSNAYDIAADNEWIRFLRSFGIVGIVWLLVFMFSPLLLKRNKSLESRNQTRFILSILFLSVTYMIPAAIILSPITFPMLLVLLSIDDHNMATLRVGYLKKA